LRNTLATISAPLRKKAAETWSEAYSKSVQAELYSPAIPELADRLADLHVTQPGRAQGVRGRFRLSGVPADGGREGLSDSLKKFRERLQKNPKDSAAWTDYGNLLWGSGKPGLARIAYDRAILLNQQNAGAFNNRAVVLLSQSAAEDPVVSAEAASLWQTAIRIEPFFLTAKMNLGMLLNYYRLFGKAKNLWEQVLVKAESLGPNLPEAHDGLGVALQGLGDSKNAEIQFKRATEAGAAKSRFASVFHEAARQAISLAGGGSEGPRRCLDELADLDSGSLNGFEKEAVERLKRTCTKWKTGK
jgi:tetratricopeptide (TPR) repeat protein